MMSITTKTGDKGRTSLRCGGRVYKDDIRIEAYGVLDELCSCLGMTRSLLKDNETKGLIEALQKDLFLACKTQIGRSHIARLEKTIKGLEKRMELEERCFYLPGDNPLSSSLDIARTVARRAERMLVKLKKKKYLNNDDTLIYMNRLSDLLYLLARKYDKELRKL